MSENALGKASSDSTDTDKDSSVCPTCGQVCKSRKGMFQHHKRSHGESIAKVEVDCELCGTSHKRWRSQLNGGPYFCGQECRVEWLSNIGRQAGKELQNRITVECDYCGCETERRPSRVKRAESIYCSRQCADKDHSERMRGEGNSRWLDADIPRRWYYGPNWAEQRDKARSRDNYKCQRCGVLEQELPQQLSVHHKKPFREFDNSEKANRLDNLVCLCKSCHQTVEAWPVIPI